MPQLNRNVNRMILFLGLVAVALGVMIFLSALPMSSNAGIFGDCVPLTAKISGPTSGSLQTNAAGERQFPLSQQGAVVELEAPVSPIDSLKDFPLLRAEITSELSMAIQLVWTAERGNVDEYRKPFPVNVERRASILDLRADDAWSGKLRSLKLDFKGGGGMVSIGSVALCPNTVWAASQLRWFDFRQRVWYGVQHINFLHQPLADTHLTRTGLGALVALILIGVVWLTQADRARRRLLIFGAMASVWVALDLVWLHSAASNSLLSARRFGLVSEVEAHRRADDALIWTFADQLKPQLAATQKKLPIVRVKIDEASFSRLRYYMLPRRTDWEGQFPGVGEIFVVPANDIASFSAEHSTLSLKDNSKITAARLMSLGGFVAFRRTA